METTENKSRIDPANTIFGRLGGEEFALVYKNHAKDEVITNVELIRSEIEQNNTKINKKILTNEKIKS